MKWIDMEIGGPGWNGWSFKPWGKAKEWRIITPDGTNYTRGEIEAIRASQLDLDYLRKELKRLQLAVSQTAIFLSDEDLAAIRYAAEIINRATSPYKLRKKDRIRVKKIELKRQA